MCMGSAGLGMAERERFKVDSMKRIIWDKWLQFNEDQKIWLRSVRNAISRNKVFRILQKNQYYRALNRKMLLYRKARIFYHFKKRIIEGQIHRKNW